MTAINTQGLTKQYGSFTAVDGLSMQVRRGELLGFLGVNGAGKSTTINMLSTLLKPDAGTAEVCGHALGREDDAIRRCIGVVYQHNCLDALMSVRENLLLRGMLYGMSRSDAQARMAQLERMLALDELLPRRYGKLSGGQKRRCEIAAALMHAPKVLFLDEPTTGLDPATRKDVWSAIDALRKTAGMTVLLTTHYMEEAAEADRIVVISKGRMMALGTPFELKERYAADHVRVHCTAQARPQVMQRLAAAGLQPVEEPSGAAFTVRDTRMAIEPVYAVRDLITGFEAVQGTMDDVFLNICGESAKGEEK